jgi:hypothetical protein
LSSSHALSNWLSTSRIITESETKRTRCNFLKGIPGLIEAGKVSGEFRIDVDAQAVATWLVGGVDGMML